MKIKKLLVSLWLVFLTIFFLPSLVFSYPWPFYPFDQQHKIRQTLGAYREGGYFHEGVDIVPNDGSLNAKVLRGARS